MDNAPKGRLLEKRHINFDRFYSIIIAEQQKGAQHENKHILISANLKPQRKS